MPRTPLAILLLLAVSPSLAGADELRLAPRTLRLAQDQPMPAPPPAYVPAAPPGTYAPAGPPPSSGVGLLVAGGILLGLGAVNLATAPICKTDLVSSRGQDTCRGLALGLGGVMVGVGTPRLIVGVSKRRTCKRWQQAHPVMAGLLEGIKLSTRRNGAELFLGARF